MDETKEKMLNFKASNVETCRICLSTDVKMHSLSDSHLGTCMESIGGFTISYEGLPNYVCYECAPILIKCNKLIEKSNTAQATLLEIFTKNGQINKQLIEDQNKSKLKLQSSLDSYLLLNYFYIKYDDNTNTSDFIKIETDPNEKVNIKLKNEIKDESSEEVSDSEILKMFNNSSNMKEETDSDGDVEAIEVDVPVVEIISDDEKIGDDFISLRPYKVKTNKVPKRAKGLRAHNFDVPNYDIPKVRGKVQKGKKKKKIRIGTVDTLSSVNADENYVKKFFNIDIIPPIRTNDKKIYSCKYCTETFEYIEEAKDHTFIGCTKPQRSNGDKSAFPNLGPAANITQPSQPRAWKEWPGASN